MPSLILSDVDGANYDAHSGLSKLRIKDLRLAFLRSPKNFIISNKDKIYKVNKDIISELSPFIEDKINASPDFGEIHLEIDDPFNTLEKFVKVLNGQKEEFDTKIEQKTLITISRLLHISIPDSIVMPHLENHYNSTRSSKKFIFFPEYSIHSYIQQSLPKNFTLIVKERRFTLSPMLLSLSDVIYEKFIEDPYLSEFSIDIDADDESLDIVINFLTCKAINITMDNIDNIENIVNVLKIGVLSEILDKFRKNFEHGQAFYDEQEENLNILIEHQELLFNLNHKNYTNAITTIKNSKWFHSKEDVQEFVVNFFNAVMYRPDYKEVYIHAVHELSEIPELGSFFVSFLGKYAVSIGFKSRLACPFIYMLYREGVIEKKYIVNELFKEMKKSSGKGIIANFLYVWFLPEVDEFYPSFLKSVKGWTEDPSLHLLLNLINHSFRDYQRDNWLLYKKDRDLLSNPNLFAVCIKNDDVEELQALSTSISFKFSSTKIPPFLFENIDEINLIDYAAQHAAVNCFKYMILNDDTVTLLTLEKAIIGGSIDIVHLVDNKLANPEIAIPEYFLNINSLFYEILWYGNDFVHVVNPTFYNRNIYKPSIFTLLMTNIAYQRSELFEWIMNKYILSNQFLFLALSLFQCIASNNLKTFMTIIDSGLFVNIGEQNINENLRIVCRRAAYYGLNDILQIAVKIYGNDILRAPLDPTNKRGNDIIDKMSVFVNAATFGSMKIIRLFDNKYGIPDNLLYHLLEQSITYGHKDITFYLLQNKINSTQIEHQNISQGMIENLIKASAVTGDWEIFELLLNFGNISEPCFRDLLISISIYEKLEFLKKLLEKFPDLITHSNIISSLKEAINYGHIEIIKYYFTEFTLFQIPNILFSSDIRDMMCIASKNGYLDIIQLLLEYLPESFSIIPYAFQSAILEKRVETCKYLVNKFSLTPELLILIIKSDILDVAQQILIKNEKVPEFINTISFYGTCLTVAASSASFELFKLIASIPGINPNLRDRKNRTALICAAFKQRFDIIKYMIEVFKDKIDSRQISEALVAYYLNTAKPSQQYNNYNSEPLIGEIQPEKKSAFSLDVPTFFTSFNDIDINILYRDMTLLMTAASTNNTGLVNFLLSHPDIDVNQRNSNGDTALMIAAIYDNEWVVADLLNDDRTDVNACNYYGESALVKSVMINSLVLTQGNTRTSAICHRIINSPKFDQYLSNVGFALAMALKNRNEACFNALLHINNIDINHKVKLAFDGEGMTGFEYEDLLTLASKYCDNGPFLNHIIQHPTFDVRKNDVVSAVFALITNGSQNNIQMLLNLIGGEINIRSPYNGISILSYSCIYGGDTMIPLLLTNPLFDPIKSDIDTAFALSLECGYMYYSHFINYYHQNNMSLNKELCVHYHFNFPQVEPINWNYILSNFGSTLPLVFTMQGPKGMEALLAKTEDTIDINYKDCYGSSPIFTAVVLGSNPLEHLIRNPKLDVNMKNHQGITPLMHAIIYNHAVLPILLECKKVDIHITDYNGKKAYDYLIDEWNLDPEENPEPENNEEFLEWYNIIAPYHMYNISNYSWNNNYN
ncbi:hypothetical protein TRFO_36344 [Tritrichomonas foetus]|uniref:DUF3447 domain-containing protein n=1 Tax=Tritrichomonas foetus TaxID=1144522 RepID=A0A1J4JGQ9_9EUKA|nr:hypothetical protein TRFO_36344 [Tritrichomonas foetus]|eukprot:OHS97479.1 hypothetical protein TRFO_36344 [Tritrichomonas foetus]